jgi:hypothetical protein
MMRPLRLSALLALAVLALTSCADAGGVAATTVSSDFESGNLGTVKMLDETRWVLSLPDDNDNPDLPDTWRAWWYVRFDNVPTAGPMSVTVDNNAWPYYYVPVYSHDQKVWHRFDEAEVTQPDGNSIRMVKRFEESTVWLARFYPYTSTDLERYLGTLTDGGNLSREVVGTTALGRPMEVVTITNPTADLAGKRRIWIHARTHPAETGGSFLLEGLIDFLLGPDPDARTLLSSFVFSIMPMHNIDGVISGNYRTTPASQELENQWLRDPADPWRLRTTTPREVQVLRDAIAATMEPPAAIPVTVALNLHSSNSEPDSAAFFYPHFGPAALGYSEDEARLWTQQLSFIDSVESFYGAGRIAPRPVEGGASFATSNFPESWWWHNRHSDVMAITLETVYGRAGFAPRWVTPADLRALGRAVALALLTYHGLPVARPQAPAAAVRAATAPFVSPTDPYPPVVARFAIPW